MRNLVGVAYTAEGQRQQFPVCSLFVIYFSNRKFIYRIRTTNHRGQRNAVPDNGIVAENLHSCIMYIRLLVPDPSGFDDFQLLCFLPGATHMNKFGSIME